MTFTGAHPAHLATWLETHSRLGVRRFLLSTEDALTDAHATVLQSWVERGAVTMLLQDEPRRWKFNETALLQFVAHPIARRWMGQLEFLHVCVRHALQNHPEISWLLNLDLDEFMLPNAPAATISEALTHLDGQRCLHLRRHNFAANLAASRAGDGTNEVSPLASSFWRGQFPPAAPSKEERRRGAAFSQPVHPKWVLNLHALRGGSGRAQGPFLDFNLNGLAINQHSILSATRSGRFNHPYPAPIPRRQWCKVGV